MKLLDKLLYKFTNKQKIDELKKEAKKIIEDKNRDLFQPSLKDEYISMGTWKTLSHYSMMSDKKYELENQSKMFDLKSSDIKTLKELCGIVEDTISYSMSSVSPQINANVVIAEKKDRMLELVNHIKEQLK